MVSIGMASCELGVEGAKAMAEMASVMASLTSVRWPPAHEPKPCLHSALACSMSLALADYQPHVFSCSQLDLSSNRLGPEGAKALAPALVRASLTSVRASPELQPIHCLHVLTLTSALLGIAAGPRYQSALRP